MMNIRIVTDSTCDLPEEVTKSLGISVLPLYINVGDKSYLDGVDITRKEFYSRLPNFEHHPTTATPGIGAFKKAYQDLADEGATDILSIHITESLSATVDVARSVAPDLEDVNVHVIDSEQLSLGTGFIVQAAAEAAVAGNSVAEIEAMIADQSSRSYVFAAIDTLEFLRRSGRMNSVIAGIGSLIQMKPILKMNEGVATSERVRTSNGAYERLLELLEENMPLERVALVHTHADDKAQELLAKFQGQLPSGDIPSVDITPVIGTHLGPGAIGFACISAK